MQRCSECKYICKENDRIIKDDKLQTLGISFSIPSGVATVGGGVQRFQVFGNHGTVRAQGSLGNTKWAWSPYWRWNRHPDKSRYKLTATELHAKYSETVFKDRVRKLGMVFIWPTQPFSWPPCVFIFYYHLIIQLFPYYCLVAHISLLFLPALHISPF